MTLSDCQCVAVRASPTPARSRLLSAVFYTSLILVVAGVLLQVLPLLLPEAVAGRIGRNSEGLVLALLLAGWIQYARPRLAGTPRAWPVTALVVGVLVAVGVVLLLSDLPSRFRTLNETFLAAALVIPYLQVRRPLPRGLAAGLAVAVLGLTVVFHRSGTVTDLAETIGVLLLVPIAFDLVDRGILDPGARTSPRLRVAWYAVIVLAPLTFTALEYGLGVDGLLGEAVRYSVRIAEAFVALLLLHLHFAVVLRRTGRPAGSAAPVHGDPVLSAG